MEFVVEEGKQVHEECSTLIHKTSCEDSSFLLPLCVFSVYESSSTATTLAQQRSPLSKGMLIKFAENIADFAASICVFLLRNYTEANGRDDHCERLGFRRLNEYDPEGRCRKYLSSVFEENCKEELLTFPSEDELEDIDYYSSLPFAALFSAFKARGLKVTCLLCYCSEGDNIPDAFLLAEPASKLTSLTPDKFHGEEGGKWQIPYSWIMSMF
ncbi:hypothetical protein N665_0290s0067 [Sinapis alba]|nr:hypothetical protein N665_0290s0067 [Sinapis alba]